MILYKLIISACAFQFFLYHLIWPMILTSWLIETDKTFLLELPILAITLVLAHIL